MSTATTQEAKAPKRRRDPDKTRTAILEAAGKLLAKEGPEGLSVSQVAQLAGVNRGTAYQHFQSREQLVQETMDWVSERLCAATFDDPELVVNGNGEQLDAQLVSSHAIEFLMDNPELSRVWLFNILSSDDPYSDPYWSRYQSLFQEFAKSDLAQPGIDCEVHAVLMLTATFLWPTWAGAHSRSAKEREKLTRRFTNEVLRLNLHGTMRPEKFADLDEKLQESLKTDS